MTAAETLAACRAEGVALTRGAGGRLRYCPAPSPEVLRALRVNKGAILRALEAAGDADDFDLDLEIVRVEYEEGGNSVGFWIVPECCAAPQIEDEPAVRRGDLARILGLESGALRRTLLVLRAFPGARFRSVGSPAGGQS